MYIKKDNISWDNVWKTVLCCTKNRQFKIVNQMYYTPSQLHKMGIQAEYKCIKCDAADGA